jgi:hypothetical protein
MLYPPFFLFLSFFFPWASLQSLGIASPVGLADSGRDGPSRAEKKEK